VKRPANAYILFIQNFMAENGANYGGVTETVSAGMTRFKLVFAV